MLFFHYQIWLPGHTRPELLLKYLLPMPTWPRVSWGESSTQQLPPAAPKASRRRPCQGNSSMLDCCRLGRMWAISGKLLGILVGVNLVWFLERMHLRSIKVGGFEHFFWFSHMGILIPTWLSYSKKWLNQPDYADYYAQKRRLSHSPVGLTAFPKIPQLFAINW